MATMADLAPGLVMYRQFVAECRPALDDVANLKAEMVKSIGAGRCIVGEMVGDGSLGGVLAIGKRGSRTRRGNFSPRPVVLRPAIGSLERASDAGSSRKGLPTPPSAAFKAFFSPMAGTDPAKVDRSSSGLAHRGVYLSRDP